MLNLGAYSIADCGQILTKEQESGDNHLIVWRNLKTGLQNINPVFFEEY